MVTGYLGPNMCGRFFTTSSPDEIAAEFGLESVPIEYRTRYNIAPTESVPALVLHEGRPIMGAIRWGLVPHWAKDLSIGSRMINARAETVSSKPSFRNAFRSRRCLIIASGFYEWVTEADRTKRPFAIRPRDRRPMTFAGLWERWESPSAEVVTTCTILTTEADQGIRWIHHRMPVILGPEDRLTWLDPDSDIDLLERVIEDRAATPLETFEVGTIVNSARNDGPECLEPVGPIQSV